MLRFGQAPYLECSSKGDKRLSAFNARIPSAGNKSIEELYQAAKVFSDGSTGLTWKEAKGKKAINMHQVSNYYKALWIWYLTVVNIPLMQEIVASEYKGFSDIFGQPDHNCQAEIIHELVMAHRAGNTKYLLNWSKPIISIMYKGA